MNKNAYPTFTSIKVYFFIKQLFCYSEQKRLPNIHQQILAQKSHKLPQSWDKHSGHALLLSQDLQNVEALLWYYVSLNYTTTRRVWLEHRLLIHEQNASWLFVGDLSMSCKYTKRKQWIKKEINHSEIVFLHIKLAEHIYVTSF